MSSAREASVTALDGFRTSRPCRFNERGGENKDRFAKTLGSVAGHRLTYRELTGN